MTPLSIAAYNGHERCVKMLTLWMVAHNRMCFQQIWQHNNTSLPMSEEDQKNTRTLDSWKSDCMISILCVLSQDHVRFKSILYDLLAYADLNESIPGLRREGVTSLIMATDYAQTVHSYNIQERYDPDTSKQRVAERDHQGHGDIAAKIWNSKDRPQSQADILLFEAMAFEDILPLQDHFLTISSSTKDARVAIFHRMISRASQHCCYNFRVPILQGCDWDREVDYGPKIGVQRCCVCQLVTRLVRGEIGLIPPRGLSQLNTFSLATIHLLIKMCSPEPLAELLQMFPELAREKDSRGRTVLMAATASGSLVAVDIVLRALEAINEDISSFVHELSADGFSAISYAIYHKPLHRRLEPILRRLLKVRGVDPLFLFHKTKILPSCDAKKRGDEQSCIEWRPFTYLILVIAETVALGPRHARAQQKLESMLRKALREHDDRVKLSRLLMECFVDNLELSFEGYRGSESQLLEWCCRMNGIEWLEFLLECCPQLEDRLHLPDSDGMTMLAHASLAVVEISHTEIVDFLLDTIKVDPGYSDERGCTALSSLIQKVYTSSRWTTSPRRMNFAVRVALDAALLLVRSGADPLVEDKEGFSPLSYAVLGCRWISTATETDEWDPRDNIPNYGGIIEGTIFHRLLQDENTPLEQVEGRGEKLLDLALEVGNYNAVRLLLKRSDRDGFWVNRSKLRTSRRLSCDFSPRVNLDAKIDTTTSQPSSKRRNSVPWNARFMISGSAAHTSSVLVA